MFIENYYSNKKIEKEALELTKSLDYWLETLFEKCVRMFEWNGLPKTIPQKEIEQRAILDGFAGMVKDSKAGLIVASGGLSGVTVYCDEFKNFTFAAPTAAGGTFEIGKNAVLIENTSLRNPLLPLILRYADLLAHAEISLKMALINNRVNNAYAVSDNEIAESVNAYYNKIYNGKNGSILDDALVNSVQNIANARSAGVVAECIEARNDILRAFFAEIGVRFAKDKKERLITDEVSADNQMLLLNINDMKRQREKAAKEINRVFGLNVSVKLSEEFAVIEEKPQEMQEEEKQEGGNDIDS